MEQQMRALSEIIKSLPANIQVAVLPYVIALTDTPLRKMLFKQLRMLLSTYTRTDPATDSGCSKQALADAGNDIKLRELELKERKAGSEIKEIDARSVQIGVKLHIQQCRQVCS
jgi:hypothetical protein